VLHGQVVAVRESVTAALDALLGWQQHDGGFPLLRWPHAGVSVQDDPLFSTAAILLAIGERLPDDHRCSALALLRRRQGEDGLWRFDDAARLPPDADDTAHALAALRRFADKAQRPSAADIARLAAFVQPDGRIATWLAQDELGRAITDDVVVVANVLYAMALSQPATARRWLQRWLLHRRAVGSGEDATPYYLHVETVWYAWGRALAALGLDAMPALPTPVAPTSDPSPLRCALALSVGLAPQHQYVAELLHRQGADGGWPAEPWFRAPGATFGGQTVTTALALEGLLRWQRRLEECSQ
jgi:hypothetical protein